MNLKSKIESILFVSIKPLSTQKLAELIRVKPAEVQSAIEELTTELNNPNRGIHLMRIGNKFQLSTAPENSKLIREYLKDEQKGELTQPALEALTIIAYRGPITKADLDIIRGVNCSLILRNLMIKGLVEQQEDKEKMAIYYQVTFDFLKYLGVSETKELPDYEKLNRDENLEKILNPDLASQGEKEEKTPQI